MNCEVCGTELTEETTSMVDENMCKDCAPDLDEDDNEGDFDLDDDDEMNIDL